MSDCRKHYLELTPPSLGDNTATIDRLSKALARGESGRPAAPVGRLDAFARIMRQSDYHLTATICPGPAGPVLVQVEPGDTTAEQPDANLATRVREVPPPFGTGKAWAWPWTWAPPICRPPCMSLADGSGAGPGHPAEPPDLGGGRYPHPHPRRGLSPAGQERSAPHAGGGGRRPGDRRRCAQRAGREPGEVAGLVAAGNTTMTHFFPGPGGADPTAGEPYIPLVNRPCPLLSPGTWASRWPRGRWPGCMPNVGSYFGGRPGGRHRGRRTCTSGRRSGHASGCGHQRRGGAGQPGMAGGLRRGGRSGPGERGGPAGHPGPVRGPSRG